MGAEFHTVDIHNYSKAGEEGQNDPCSSELELETLV